MFFQTNIHSETALMCFAVEVFAGCFSCIFTGSMPFLIFCRVLRIVGVNHGGTHPQNLYCEEARMFIPQNSAHIKYLTVQYVVYLYFVQGIIYYIAFNTGSISSA